MWIFVYLFDSAPDVIFPLNGLNGSAREHNFWTTVNKNSDDEKSD